MNKVMTQFPNIQVSQSAEKKKVELDPLFAREDSDKSDLSDINEKKFLSTLEVANEKI